MPIDLTQVDAGTTLGQIVIIVTVVGMLVTTFKDVFKGVPKSIKHRNYRNLAADLKEARLELNYQRSLNRSMREWELYAREALRQMQNSLIEAGVEDNPRIDRLLELLEENERVRGEFIEEELSHGTETGEPVER